MENINLLENRLASLEKLIGCSNKFDETKFLEILLNIENKLLPFENNTRISNVIQQANNIKKLTDLDISNDTNAEFNAKMEIILRSDKYFKNVNEEIDKLKVLSSVLDSEIFNEIPQLNDKLQKLSLNKSLLKSDADVHSNEVKEVLCFYFETIKSIGTALAGFDDCVKGLNKIENAEEDE